jgi:DNA-binding IclR family transcriptional regulator
MIGEPATSYSITDRKSLFQQLELFRQTGVAEEMQEGVVGICCAAAPVFRPDGQAVAAISCSISVFEWETRRDAIREAVAVTASRISGLA